MTFEYTPGLYRMVFDDGPLAGLEVSVRQAGAEALIAVEELPPFDGRWGPYRGALDALGALLIGWNLTEAGQPVPCNRDELVRRDPGFVIGVLARWVSDVRSALVSDVAVEDVAEPDGFDEAEIPMTVLPSVRALEPASAVRQPAPRKAAARKRAPAKAARENRSEGVEAAG